MATKQIPLTKFNINFMGQRFIGFAVSAALILGTGWLLATKGLNFGIDFTGGIVIEARTETDADLQKLRRMLNTGEYGDVSLQAFADPRDILIRLQVADESQQQKLVEDIKQRITSSYGEAVEYRKIDYVGAVVGQELIRGSLIALGLSLAAMMAYLWFRFEWQFGLGGIIALVHDAVVLLGFYSITGMEFGLTAVAAVLTVVGYSINDSVVIYDRIRENFRKYKALPTSDVINLSVNETLARTIMTGGTVVLTASALAIFGGDVINGFAVAMIFGVIVGTYSSVYISAPVLIYMGLKR